jgi:hypothetical protein
LVNFYKTTRRYNPEDSHLHTHRRENLKFYYNHIVVPDVAVAVVYSTSRFQNKNLIFFGGSVTTKYLQWR